MNKKSNKLTARKTVNTRAAKQTDSGDFTGPPS